MPSRSGHAALVDLDGTLVDTAYLHTLAWSRAFRSHGIVVPQWRIHRCVGMGGDQLVPQLVGPTVDTVHGDDLRDRWEEEFGRLEGDVAPLPGARELLEELRRRGHAVIVASSSKERHLELFLDVLDAHDLVDGATTSADVEQTKPKPDVVEAAMELAATATAVMIGDSPYDCAAAAAAGIDTIGVLTGGFSEAELREAGAVAVFESPDDLRLRLGETALR